jgi:hypothetical protein
LGSRWSGPARPRSRSYWPGSGGWGDGESHGDGWVKSGSSMLYLYAVVVQASSSTGKSSTVIAWTW